MGSSLILQGGAAVAKTLKESVTQTGHGFTVGDVIRWDGALVPPKYVKAIADTAQNAEVAGVVSSTPDPNEFEVTYHGYIDLPSLAGISAPVMFLSGSAGGSLAASPPSAVGTVVKPVLTKNSNGSGYLVMNYLGTQIGGSSTIAVDEIQPVGTIMPYAGTAIPDTWLACDGNSYAMSDYPELYSKLCFTTGERAPMYGHIVDIAPSSGTIQLTEWTASAVGDYIYIKNRTTTAGGGTPDVNTEASYDFVGRIIAKGTLPSNPAAQGWTVRILGKYNSTSKRFEMPNAFVLSESGTGFASSVRVYATVATGPRGSGGSINTASIVAFNTPNLRGRFLFGEVGSGEFIPDADPATLSTFAYDYPMASWGGEERHVITTAEMPSHSHTVTNGNSPISRAFQADGNASGTSPSKAFQYADAGVTPIQATGGDAPHNNMPPYLAVRYIIKAKPYTRAAIIDGIDLPYNSLLVRDLRSRNVGGSNGDLVFHTNTSGDSGNGTERMRLTTDGKLAVGNSSVSAPASTPHTLNVLFDKNNSTTTDIRLEPGIRIFNGSGVVGEFTTLAFGTNGSYSGWAGKRISANQVDLQFFSEAFRFANGSTNTANDPPFYIDGSNGLIGIGTNSPTAKLDVNGTLKVGDFGGSTNVMAKPIGAVSGTNVGKVVPLIHFGGRAPTSLLSAGTWFVHFTGQMNGPSVPDENTVLSAAFTVTVPSGQFFGLAVNHNSNAPVRVAAQDGKSGVMGRFFTDTTAQTVAAGVDNTNHTVPAGWTEFTETGTAPFISRRYSTAGTDSPGADLTHSMVHHMADGSSAWAVMIHGFAIRIA